MSDMQRGQVKRNAAEIYDEFYVPALFEVWTEPVMEAAEIFPGQQVLDVACGTGVLTVAVAGRVGPEGVVVGLDINPGMLEVARRKNDSVDWKQGRAESLPFPDASFDAVVSQFGLMFFDDRRKALEEMVRVLKPGGRLAVVVWDSLENTPGYLAMAGLLAQLFGEEAAESMRAPYSLGRRTRLEALIEGIHLEQAAVITRMDKARFPSLETWMFTDIKGWTLADKIDETQYQQLLHEAQQALSEFVLPDGRVVFNAPAHILSGRKPETGL